MENVEKLQVLEKEIEKEYRKFFEIIGIEYDTTNAERVVGTGSWTKAPKGYSLRFATMPHIGINYSDFQKKILIVGLDIGMDECHSIQSFEERRDSISSIRKNFFHKNPHMAGTYMEVLYLLRDLYPNQWKEVCKISKTQNKSILIQLQEILPIDLLTNIAQTNFFKFVTIDRTGRIGGSDRNCFGIQSDLEDLFLKEVEILNPDIIWFQGKEFANYNIYKKLKEKRNVVASYHPSYRKANTPQYIIDLLGL